MKARDAIIMMWRRQVLGWSIPLVLVVAGCGDSDETSSTESAAEFDSDAMLVTWTGVECGYEGPAEVVDGLVRVEFVNEGDGPANIYVMKVDEGTTAQVLTDEFGEGAKTDAVPDVSLLESGAPIDSGESVVWEQSLDTGEYLLVCRRNSPTEMWLAGDFEVVEG